MPRLTAESIKSALAFINPLKDRELDLRGNKIPQIENLGATEDLYEVIDLSDNEIGKLENLPVLSRLTTLFLNNNKINRISPNLGSNVPNLHTLILTNNKFSELSEIEPLKDIPSIVTLSLMNNPVQQKTHYRAFLIHKLPNLRVLDFRKVKKQEREEAEALFGSAEGKALAESFKTNVFVPGQPDQSTAASSSSATSKLTPEERNKLKQAILNAKTNDELRRLEEALQQGRLPKELQ